MAMHNVVSTTGYVLFCGYLSVNAVSVLKMLGMLKGINWRAIRGRQPKELWFWAGCATILLLLVSWYVQVQQGVGGSILSASATRILACIVSLEIATGSYWVSTTLGNCMSDLGLDLEKAAVAQRTALSTLGNLASGILFASAGLCLLYPTAVESCVAGLTAVTVVTFAHLIVNPLACVCVALFSIGYGTRIMLHVGLAVFAAETGETSDFAVALSRLRRAKRTYFHYALLTLGTYCTSLIALPYAGLLGVGDATVLFAGVVLAVVVIFFFVPQLLIRSRMRYLHDAASMHLRSQVFALLQQPGQADTERVQSVKELLAAQRSMSKEDTRILDLQIIVPVVSSVVAPIILRMTEVLKLIEQLLD